MKQIKFFDIDFLIGHYLNAEGWYVDEYNTKYHFHEGFIGFKENPEDLPSVIRERSSCWYKKGLLHRENDLPAIVHNNGSEEWYLNGQRHRDNDLPAVSSYDKKYLEYWANGEKHRNNSPAVIENKDTSASPREIYYKKHKLHREDGPAIVFINKDKPDEFWYNNKKISEEKLYALISKKKLQKSLKETKKKKKITL